MSEVQHVEAAVGDDQFFAARAQGGTPFGKFVPRDDFLTEIHGRILEELFPRWQ
jgi:hypothetical protein